MNIIEELAFFQNFKGQRIERETIKCSKYMVKNLAVEKLMFSISVFWIGLQCVVSVYNPPLTPSLLHFTLCWNWVVAISAAFTSVADCIFQRWLQQYFLPHMLFRRTTVEHISGQQKTDRSEWVTKHSKRNRGPEHSVSNLYGRKEPSSWWKNLGVRSGVGIRTIESISMDLLFWSCPSQLPMLLC